MHRFRPNRYAVALLAFLCLQFCYWSETRGIRPATDVVPTPPGERTLHALALGDQEFYFRFKAMYLQNFGDSFGRVVSLRYYDYSKLYQWLRLLDMLNARSNMLPSMSTYYFSQTQNTSDVRYLVNYLYAHATRDVPNKWWWLLQGMYLSQYRVNDLDLTLKMAKPMINPGVPVWAQQMVAVAHEKRGEMADALRIMETIDQNSAELSNQDLRYMYYFIKERLGKLEEAKQMMRTRQQHVP